MFISPVDTSALDAGKTTTSTAASSSDPAAMQASFLKLLVAQLNNQDPMNPMDNAQMTTQMAQINTVSGIQQLNTTMQGMATQFAAMQSLQGTQMIGRSVLTAGSSLSYDGSTGSGTFDLPNAAASVKVNVVTPGGQTVGTVDMGGLAAGRQTFTWDASGYTGDKSQLKFQVVAGNSDGSTVTATSLMQGKVTGTGTDSATGALTLTLDSGSVVKYTDVKSVL
ncbi:MAG: flagellar hook capping FlgD N-terminal domain-containing protein [Acidovorax sp.]